MLKLEIKCVEMFGLYFAYINAYIICIYNSNITLKKQDINA